MMQTYAARAWFLAGECVGIAGAFLSHAKAQSRKGPRDSLFFAPLRESFFEFSGVL
jgi:hypothetical protein